MTPEVSAADPYWKARLEKPLVHWMLAFVDEITQLIPGRTIEREPLSFEFLYCIQFQDCSEESENVICAGPIFWFITITDADGVCVHPNWTFAMDDGGDVRAKRGSHNSAHGLVHGESYVCERAYVRMLDIVREHLRLRALRTARTKQ